MKVNYELEMQKILQEIGENSEKKILLHSCCAPCSCAILENLSNYLKVDIYFYNPNITEESEYIKRFKEQGEYLKDMKYSVNLIEAPYNPKTDFFEKVKGLEKVREGRERCFLCYSLRMEETAKKAKELNYDYFGTVLSISPLKNTAWINEIGIELEKKYGVKFFKADFKKKGRYLRGIEISREKNLYRQDYCGCIFSKLERQERVKENEN